MTAPGQTSVPGTGGSPGGAAGVGLGEEEAPPRPGERCLPVTCEVRR